MRYKKGDKVRIIDNSRGVEFKIGEVVTITELYPDGKQQLYRADSETDFWYVNDSQIEPVKETKMKTRDKDYSGCHPQIAEALKQGK